MKWYVCDQIENKIIFEGSREEALPEFWKVHSASRARYSLIAECEKAILSHYLK